MGCAQAGFERAGKLEAVHAGQHNVANDEVRSEAEGLLQAVPAVGRNNGLIGAAKLLFQEKLQTRVILNGQNLL